MISQEQEGFSYLNSLVQRLEKSTIDGSAITMCLLPNKNMTQYKNLLNNQISQASNIKDKSNKMSVVQGLKSIRQVIKEMKKVPQNGLILIAANVMMLDDHTYQKVVQMIEPPRPITKQVYSCGKNFNFSHIHQQILVNDQTVGFIIIDGSSALFATVKGSHRKILKQIRSDIMRNHNKGGQSSVRFSRLREQSRYNYVKAACQQANRQFAGLNQNIQSYIIGGSANMKNQFIENQLLNPKIKSKIIKTLDIAQGSEQGLKLAINQSKSIIMDQSLINEKKALNDFFQEMKRNELKVINGYNFVIQVLQLGMVQKVICSSQRSKLQLKNVQELCRKNGSEMVMVSQRSEESEVFVKSFGGMGAILRYQFDASYLKESAMDEEQTGFMVKQEFGF